VINGPELTIDLAALRGNVRVLRARVAPARIMAIVKDDAYSQGADVIVDALVGEGVEHFGTLDPDAAVRLRQRHPGVRAFAWHLDHGADLDAAVRAGVDLGITDEATLMRVIAASARTGAVPRIHLQLDSGLSRGGTRLEHWCPLLEVVTPLVRAGVVQLDGVFTHLAEASDDDDSRSLADYDVAVAAVHEALPESAPLLHVAASAASSARSDARYDLVRIGAFLSGIAPGSGIGPAQLGLQPIATLSAPVEPAGEGRARLSFGGIDGMPAAAAGRVSVAVSGRRCLIVSVDPLGSTVAVDHPVAPGSRAYIVGSGNHGEAVLQEWADTLGTIGEELIVRMARSVPRRVVDSTVD